MKTLHSRFMSCISPSWITVASAPASKVAIFTAQSKADMPSRLRATHQLMTTQKHRLQHKGLDFILQMPCHPADGNTLFRKVYGCMHTRAVHTPRRLSTCMIAMRVLYNVLWFHGTRRQLWSRATRLLSQSRNCLTNSYFATACFAEPVPAGPHRYTSRYGTILMAARRGSSYILSYCMCQRYSVRSGRTTAPDKDWYRLHCLTYIYICVTAFQAFKGPFYISYNPRESKVTEFRLLFIFNHKGRYSGQTPKARTQNS